MISDEELKAISEVDVNLIVKNYCLVFKIPQVEAEAAIGPVMRAQEMAQELLAYREAERKSKSWDDTEAWVQTRRKVTEFYPFARKALSFRAGMDSARTIVS